MPKLQMPKTSKNSKKVKGGWLSLILKPVFSQDHAGGDAQKMPTDRGRLKLGPKQITEPMKLSIKNL